MIEYCRFFANGKFASDFISGKIYMNYLGYFWEHGFEGQQDFSEGSIFTAKPEILGFPEDLSAVVYGNVVNRLLAYRYCNICSFSRIVADKNMKYVIRPDTQMQKFGEYVVRIRDFDCFLLRIKNAALKNGDYILGESIKYVDTTTEKCLNCFVKDRSYNWQFEWRLACLHDIESLREDAKIKRTLENRNNWKPYILDIGDISDICDICPSKTLWNNNINILYPNYIIYDKVNNKETFSQEELILLFREVTYGLGINIKNQEHFQEKVSSISNEIITMFRI